MDLILSLVCGSLGALALAGLRPGLSFGKIIDSGLGMIAGYLSMFALAQLGLGLAYHATPGGNLDPTALAVQLSSSAISGIAALFAFGYLRRTMKG